MGSVIGRVLISGCVTAATLVGAVLSLAILSSAVDRRPNEEWASVGLPVVAAIAAMWLIRLVSAGAREYSMMRVVLGAIVGLYMGYLMLQGASLYAPGGLGENDGVQLGIAVTCVFLGAFIGTSWSRPQAGAEAGSDSR